MIWRNKYGSNAPMCVPACALAVGAGRSGRRRARIEENEDCAQTGCKATRHIPALASSGIGGSGTITLALRSHSTTIPAKAYP